MISIVLLFVSPSPIGSKAHSQLLQNRKLKSSAWIKTWKRWPNSNLLNLSIIISEMCCCPECVWICNLFTTYSQRQIIIILLQLSWICHIPCHLFRRALLMQLVHYTGHHQIWWCGPRSFSRPCIIARIFRPVWSCFWPTFIGWLSLVRLFIRPLDRTRCANMQNPCSMACLG